MLQQSPLKDVIGGRSTNSGKADIVYPVYLDFSKAFDTVPLESRTPVVLMGLSAVGYPLSWWVVHSRCM